jgi:hypothetical protein
MTRAALVALLALLALAGCADPYSTDHQQRDSAVPAPRRATEPPGQPAGPAPMAASAPASSPRHAASAFAARWTNWDWRHAAEQQHALRRLATGALAAQLGANARSARRDASLARDKPSARGSVAAIDLTVRRGRAAGLVVTREQTYTNDRADLGGQHYRVYRIALMRQHNGWGVSTWQPQP